MTIGHHQLRMVVDSGSDASYLSPSAYNVLGVQVSDHNESYVVNGLGGTAMIDTFVLQDMYFGSVHLHDVVLGVFPNDVPVSKGRQAEDGVIGYDILQLFDEGFDLPHNRLSFYQPQNCKVNATPWQGDYAPIAYTRPQGNGPQIPVTVNDKTFQLILDSDSDSTFLMQRSLDSAQVSAESTKTFAGHGIGMGAQTFTIEHAQFKTVIIGAEEFQDDWLIEDLTPSAELNSVSDGSLGEDYLRTHRVFIANSTHTIYLGLTIQPGS